MASQKYAKDQPAGFANRIERVAIVGAGGSIGKFLAAELVKTGKHTVTALTRQDSTSKIPEGVKIVNVDYDDEATVIAALKDQQFLIITVSFQAPQDLHSKIVQAAAKAGVPYIMPNCYSADVANKKLSEENLAGAVVRGRIAEIESLGVSSWVALVCSFWYEYSMSLGAFGFDFAHKKATLFDDGNTKINVSTWEQCGRAVAALLSLKELPEDEKDHSPTLSNWRNKPLYTSSFLISQHDMFESWKRVSGDKDEDWKVEYVPSADAYKAGLEKLQKGDMTGFIGALYARTLFPNGDGDYGSKYGLANAVLGLPQEDLDERTKVAKQMLNACHP